MSAKPKKPQAGETSSHDTGITERMAAAAPVVVPVRVPECPAGDPALGMKTPEVVAWWFQYFPEEAAVKYAGLTLD